MSCPYLEEPLAQLYNWTTGSWWKSWTNRFLWIFFCNWSFHRMLLCCKKWEYLKKPAEFEKHFWPQGWMSQKTLIMSFVFLPLCPKMYYLQLTHFAPCYTLDSRTLPRLRSSSTLDTFSFSLITPTFDFLWAFTDARET